MALKKAWTRFAFQPRSFDFESCQEAVPIFPGTRPYMQLCFQWSAHVLDSPKAESAHLEHLHGDQTDPRPEFCRTLWEAVKDAATIVHYSSFEKTQLKAMAADDIPHASDLFILLETHGADLEKIVKEHVYLEEFKGKSSIKYVLPALVPGMTYEGLAVNNGTAAAAAFRRLTGREPYDGDLPTLRRALLDYCKQETLAMVKLYEA